jgi:hypothetical protein
MLFPTVSLEHEEIVVSTFEASHNHPLTPFRFARNVLRPEVKSLIIEMHEAGIDPATILQVLENRGTFLTSTPLCAICKPRRIRKFSGEWHKLFEWAESVGGNHHILMGTIHGEEKTVAVSAILPSELAAMRQYGELIEIDGMRPNLHPK